MLMLIVLNGFIVTEAHTHTHTHTHTSSGAFGN